jgi:hypothetical protein
VHCIQRHVEQAEINGETCHAVDSEKETIYMRKIIIIIIINDFSFSKTAGYKPVDNNLGLLNSVIEKIVRMLGCLNCLHPPPILGSHCKEYWACGFQGVIYSHLSSG